MSSVVRVITIASLLFLTNGAQAQQGDMGAQDYIEQARKNMGLRNRADCGVPDKDGAIVVCARRGEDPNRLPLPEERADLAGKRLTGDIPSAKDVNPKQRSGGVVGQGYGCVQGVPLIKGFETAAKMLIKAIDPDAPVEDAPVKIPKRLQRTK